MYLVCLSLVQVITSGEEPCHIVWASEAWLRLCEYSSPQVLGHTLELIQGPMTDPTSVTSLMDAIRNVANTIQHVMWIPLATSRMPIASRWRWWRRCKHEL